MNSANRSSLDRYILSNGYRLMGNLSSTEVYRHQTGFGILFTVLGLCGLAASPWVGWPLAVGMLGPLIAGSTNWIVGSTMQSRARAAVVPATKVRLTPEAKGLLNNTMHQMGGWRVIWGHRHSRWQPSGWANTGAYGPGVGPLFRTCEEILNARAFELLESAARECNRIQASIMSSNNSAILKRASELAAAADEGMAQVLHQAALLDRYPESGSLVEGGAQSQIDALREIADRLEALQVREPLLTERAVSPNTVDRVLDDLRMESIAREELSVDVKGEGEIKRSV